MAYSDLDNLIEIKNETILLQLAGEGDPLTINQDWIDRAIADADAVIDLYCKKKYIIPFSPVPQIVVGWSSVLAVGRLYERNNSGRSTGSEAWEISIEAVMDQLKMVSTGELEIEAPLSTLSTNIIKKYETAKFAVTDMDILL